MQGRDQREPAWRPARLARPPERIGEGRVREQLAEPVADLLRQRGFPLAPVHRPDSRCGLRIRLGPGLRLHRHDMLRSKKRPERSPALMIHCTVATLSPLTQGTSPRPPPGPPQSIPTRIHHKELGISHQDRASSTGTDWTSPHPHLPVSQRPRASAWSADVSSVTVCQFTGSQRQGRHGCPSSWSSPTPYTRPPAESVLAGAGILALGAPSTPYAGNAPAGRPTGAAAVQGQEGAQTARGGYSERRGDRPSSTMPTALSTTVRSPRALASALISM